MVGETRNRMAAVLACASLVAFTACGGDNAQIEDTAGTTVGAATGDVAPAPAVAPGATTADAMMITGGEPELIQVLATVDQSEVEAGRLATDKARNAQVKQFARTLVNEHSRSMRRAGEIGKALGVSLTTGTTGTAGRTGDTAAAATRLDTAAQAGAGMTSQSAVVNHLQSMHSQMMDQLRSASGAGFDSAFVNGQVQAHQQVLDMLQRSQGQMQVQNSQLQQHVQQVTQSIEKHLEQARQLQQRLSGEGTDTGSATRSDTAGKARTDTSRRS